MVYLFFIRSLVVSGALLHVRGGALGLVRGGAPLLVLSGVSSLVDCPAFWFVASLGSHS